MNPHIARWRQLLADEEAWYRLPFYEYKAAIQAADKLLSEGLIDDLEHFDLACEAAGARDFYIEAMADDFIQPNRLFDLVEAGAKVGHMDGTMIVLDDSSGRLMARRCSSGWYVSEPALGICIGRIEGDQMMLLNGRRLSILHVSTRINGVEIPA